LQFGKIASGALHCRYSRLGGMRVSPAGQGLRLANRWAGHQEPKALSEHFLQFLTIPSQDMPANFMLVGRRDPLAALKAACL
jgi:hypothetical protein